MDAYRYTPLEYRNSIRLLVLRPGKFDDPIECCLVETIIYPQYSYIALSYVWGDAADRVPCILRETSRGPAFGQSLEDFFDVGPPRKLDITPNLASALQHLRIEENFKILWADAICINQEDIVERSQQIQLMIDIYRSADVVCIWLGLRDYDSDLAFKWVCYWEDKLRGDQEGFAHSLDEDEDAERAEQSAEGHHIGVSDEELDAISNTFSPTASRKWWERKWTIQEFVFAKKALLVCGDRAIWWDALDLVFNGIQSVIGSSKVGKATEYSNAGQVMIAFDTFERLRILRKSSTEDFYKGPELGTQLQGILNFTQQTLCTDPRDHVYGILGLLGPNAKRINPDYSKTERQVFFDVALVMLTGAQDLDFLCAWYPVGTSSEQEDLIPSWVPNIADANILSNFRLYRAGVGLPLSSNGTSLERQGVLNLKGICCGIIDSLAPSIDPDGHFDGQAFLEWNLESLAPDLCPRDGDVSDDFVRVLVGDLDVGGFINHARGQERLSAQRLDHYKQSYNERVRPGMSAEDLELKNARNADPVLAFAICIQAILQLMCKAGVQFCRTSKGHLGWAPKGAEAGDCVYVIFGSKIPFFLRPQDRDTRDIDQAALGAGEHFTMVGTGYFQGVMDGELLNDLDGNRVSGETVYLH